AVFRDHRLEEAFIFARMQDRAVEERNLLVEDSGIAGGLQIVGRNIGQPDAIIGDASANSLTRWRKPPVLDIALYELPPRRAQQMLTRQVRLRSDERHHVLELIAKSIGAARLIKCRSRPKPAGERLIKEPTIQQDVHGMVGCSYLNRAEDLIPMLNDGAQDGIKVGGSVAGDERKRLLCRLGLAKEKYHLRSGLRL